MYEFYSFLYFILRYSKVNLSKPNASSNVKYDVINHDAYMFSGNSGGMLVNLAYEVVGINSWGGTTDTYENHIGLASPVLKIKEFISQNERYLR